MTHLSISNGSNQIKLEEVSVTRRMIWLTVVVFAIWTAIGVMNTLQRIANTTGEREMFSIWMLAKIGMGTHWLKAFLSLPLIVFVERFPLGLKNWKSRLPLHFLALVLYVIAFILIRPYVVPTIYYGSAVPKVITFWEASYVAFRSFLLDILYGFLLTVLGAYLWQYNVRIRNGQLMQERMQARLAGAELQLLKMQLQPHFLFNTLHTISNLAAIDSSKAQIMIARLGALLRISLEHVSSESVSLRRELQFLDSYLDIERARFEERLQVVIDIDAEAMNAEVPNMFLQPLVENSIQHGISKKAQVGLITIYGHRQSNRVLITIDDNGGGSRGQSDSGGLGIGLSNTQARLQQLYGLDFAFHLITTTDGTRVEIDIPFRFIEDPVSQELSTPWRPYVS